MSNPFSQQAAPAPQQQQQAPVGIATPSGAPAGNLADQFARGSVAGGDKLTGVENLGRPVVIRPLETVDGMQTSQGPADAVRAEWIWLDTFNPQVPAVVESGLVFGKVMNTSLRSTLSSPTHSFVLGQVAQGQARNGNNPPWILDDVADNVVPTAGQAVQAAGWA